MTTAAPPSAPPAAEGRNTSALARTLREIPVLLVCAAVIAFVLKTFVAQAFYIPSGSMLPQLEVNDRVVVSKVSYRLHSPRRGDIVVFDCPPAQCPDDGSSSDGNVVTRALRAVAEGIGLVQPSTHEFIKRVVGLPGEVIEARDGIVHVDGRPLAEPYLAPGTMTANLPPTRVPDRTLFVMGDNRSNSSDSRSFGPIARSSVVGRTIVKVWPPGQLSFL